MREELKDAIDVEEKKDEAVDESVRILRETAASDVDEASHFSEEDIKKGDGIFRLVLIGGLIVAGLVMILLATFSKEKAGLFIGGVLFAGFGLLLEFLSTHIKKD